jgi:hypothetical protein
MSEHRDIRDSEDFRGGIQLERSDLAEIAIGHKQWVGADAALATRSAEQHGRRSEGGKTRQRPAACQRFIVRMSEDREDCATGQTRLYDFFVSRRLDVSHGSLL